MYDKHFHDAKSWPLCCISPSSAPSAIALLHRKWLRWGWVLFKSRLQNDDRRFGSGLAGLFSQQILLNLIKRCSNQHAEVFMNETNMRRFEMFLQIESFQVDIKSLKYRKESF